jgi:hypothetical protein
MRCPGTSNAIQRGVTDAPCRPVLAGQCPAASLQRERVVKRGWRVGDSETSLVHDVVQRQHQPFNLAAQLSDISSRFCYRWD